MSPVEIFLIFCVAFAALALLLIGVSFIINQCSSSAKTLEHDVEENVPLNYIPNRPSNNEPIPSTSRVTSPTIPRVASAPSVQVYPDLGELPVFCANCRKPRPRTMSAHSQVSTDTQILPEELRAIQNAILRNKDQRISIENNNGENQIAPTDLIIGVDANCLFSSGYCVNPHEKWVEFYRIQTEHFPWQTNQDDQLDDMEYETRNFFFALMLWYDKMEIAKKFHIFTGSRASTQDNNRLCRKVAKLLEHFWHCEMISVGNDNRFHVSPKQDATSFALKIIPAEDLSVGNFEDFFNFMSKYHEIPLTNFIGTHSIMNSVPGVEQSRYSYEIMDHYHQYIDKVRNVRKKWKEPCPKCSYVDDENTSLMITMKS